MDDLTFLETVYLANIGIASYNIRNHIASNVPTHNQMISSDKLNTQNYLNEIEKWTEKKKMVLNEKKTKCMIFNSSKKFQFTSDLKLKGEKLNVVNETKLLGTILTSDLKWNRNTQHIVKSANGKMRMLHIASKFVKNKQDWLQIYKSFIRSRLEFSCVVWNSSLTKENEHDIERVQKAAVKLILKEAYKDYESGLKMLNIESLVDRRNRLCLKFAKQCLKNENFKKTFSCKETKSLNEEKEKWEVCH